MFLLPECYRKGEGREARPLMPKAPQWLCLWPMRSSFAECAPCAHQREEMLRRKLSASKNVPATGPMDERFARIASPFIVKCRMVGPARRVGRQKQRARHFCRALRACHWLSPLAILQLLTQPPASERSSQQSCRTSSSRQTRA